MPLFPDESFDMDCVFTDSQASRAPKQRKSKSISCRSPDGRAAVGAALRAVLRNIQALRKDYALRALDIFQSFLAEDHEDLSLEDTCEALRELGLSAYVDDDESDDGEKVSAEANRQLRLWSSSDTSNSIFTTDEQCFVWLAWRGQRYVESANLLWPIFRALDANADGAVNMQDIEPCLQAASTPISGYLVTTPVYSPRGRTANGDTEKLTAVLNELVAYHSGSEPNDALISFPQFIAVVCDAQDKFALHRLSLIRPAALVMRYDRGVPFLRPEEMSCFARPEDQEAIQQACRSRQRREIQAKPNAELVLSEASAAKRVAESPIKMVEEPISSLQSPRSTASLSPRSAEARALAERAAILRRQHLAPPSQDHQMVSSLAERAAILRQMEDQAAKVARKKVSDELLASKLLQ